MATVRKMEYRDIGPVEEILNGMALRGEELGSDFFHPDAIDRANGFNRVLVAGLESPDQSLLLVGEHGGEIVAVLMAHLNGNYPYARERLTAYVPALWFKNGVEPFVAGRILIRGMEILKNFMQEKQTGKLFGNTYHADERARKLMRRMGFKATYIRYEVEV
jgi:hypothetical protein